MIQLLVRVLPAAEAVTDRPRELFRAWWLWVGLALLGLVLIRIVAALGASRRRALLASGRKRKKGQVRSAWEEAGKRVEAEPLEEPDDDIDDEDEDEDEREKP